MKSYLPAAVSLSAFFISSVASPVTAQNVFSGVWHPGTGGHAAWVTSDWDNFTSTWGDLEEDGLRMDDFEVYFEGSTPVYAGLFRQAAGGYAAWITTDWNGFLAKWDELGRANLRMHDFETYVIGGERWYAGFFREGTDGHAAWISDDWRGFSAKWDEFGRANLRMHDFETYEVDGTYWYAGIFREGTDGHAAWFTADWTEFNDKWTEFEALGLRMIDFEFFQEGGVWYYGGIFREGTGGRYGWFGVDWQNFTSFWHERVKEGFRLDDIEIFPSSCSNVCMNQVVLPPPDYYDYGITRTADHCPGLPGTCAVPGNNVPYRAPFHEEDGQRLVRLSAVLIEHQIFTLPFTDTDMKHNGWLYSPGSWHHAVDYYNGKNFEVRAAAPGEVIFVGWDSWSGGTVILSHEAGGEADRFRTIYMHLLNGAEADCTRSWTMTVPTLSNPELANFQDYLNDTNCNQNGSGVPDSGWWGTNSDVIPVSVGDMVGRGQVLARAGSTGPGGCGCSTGGSGPNHHLHIFFAHRDPTNDEWYFIDPYGIYGPTECYPTRDDADGASPETPCARYPSAWVGGAPRIPDPEVFEASFKRGDSNGDGMVNISDPIHLLGCSFLGTSCPTCADAADSNDDGEVNISDAVFALNCLFVRSCAGLGGTRCETDAPAGDRLSCRTYEHCRGAAGER